MALQFSAAMRNAMLDQIETTVGVSPLLKCYTGTLPGVGNAATGTLLYSITCPSDWANAASAGAKTKLGTWQDAAADATGTPGYFRLNTSGDTPVIEGSAAVSSGDLSHDATVTIGGVVTVSTFTLTAGNA
jgi:hypothetical protein